MLKLTDVRVRTVLPCRTFGSSCTVPRNVYSFATRKQLLSPSQIAHSPGCSYTAAYGPAPSFAHARSPRHCLTLALEVLHHRAIQTCCWPPALPSNASHTHGDLILRCGIYRTVRLVPAFIAPTR